MRTSSYPSARAALRLAMALGVAAAGASCRREPPGYDAQVEALAHEVESEGANAALARDVDARLADATADPEGAAAQARERLARLGLGIRRVPGLFYVSHAWTGADLRVVEAWLGAPAPLIATDEVGTVDDNAATIAAALRAEGAAGHRLVVWSASKGSADLLAAIAADPDAARAVALWIDLVGLLDGTPLTDPGASATELAAIGLPAPTARSMSRVEREAFLARVAWPQALRVVHVAGFPDTASISERAKSGFERLRPLGPNDGWLLLAGLARRHGPVLVLRGADHYLLVPSLRPRLLALLETELEAMEDPAPPGAAP